MILMTNAHTRASLSDKFFLCALFGTILILALYYRVRHPKDWSKKYSTLWRNAQDCMWDKGYKIGLFLRVRLLFRPCISVLELIDHGKSFNVKCHNRCKKQTANVWCIVLTLRSLLLRLRCLCVDALHYWDGFVLFVESVVMDAPTKNTLGTASSLRVGGKWCLFLIHWECAFALHVTSVV